MPSRRRCLIGGLLCIALAAALFGWFIEPSLESALLPYQPVQQQQHSDATLEASNPKALP